MLKIEYDVAKAELQKLADERPDYIYANDPILPSKCVYGWANEPACIMGHLLYRLDIDTFIRVTALFNTRTIENVITAGVIDCDAKTETLLSRTQANQDACIPWGDAVRSGIHTTENGLAVNESYVFSKTP